MAEAFSAFLLALIIAAVVVVRTGQLTG